MSGLSEQQLAAPRVTVRLDSFDFMRPAEKQVQVRVDIPGVVCTSYLLAADRWESLRDVEWIDALNEAHSDWEREVFIDTSRKDKAKLREWLAVDENQDVLNAAWFNDRAGRDPVSRSLLRDKARLAERVAELEQQLAASVGRDVTGALRVIHRHGDMSEQVRREIGDLLADAESGERS